MRSSNVQQPGGSPGSAKPAETFKSFLYTIVGFALTILVIVGFTRLRGCNDSGDPVRDNATIPAKAAEAKPIRAVTFTTTDGWLLTADVYMPSDKPMGAVILLHQRGGSASDWRDLCQALRLRGIVCVALDQRGAGRSLSHDVKQNGDDAPWDTSNDIDAAVKWLAGNTGAGKGGSYSLNVGLVGASYGANNALIYSSEHNDLTRPGSIKTVVLFSPGANYNGLDGLAAAKKWTGPIQIFYATFDSIAGLGPAAIRDASPSHDKDMHQIDDDNHGTALLNEDTINTVEVFLMRTLPQH